MKSNLFVYVLSGFLFASPHILYATHNENIGGEERIETQRGYVQATITKFKFKQDPFEMASPESLQEHETRLYIHRFLEALHEKSMVKRAMAYGLPVPEPIPSVQIKKEKDVIYIDLTPEELRQKTIDTLNKAYKPEIEAMLLNELKNSSWLKDISLAFFCQRRVESEKVKEYVIRAAYEVAGEEGLVLKNIKTLEEPKESYQTPEFSPHVSMQLDEETRERERQALELMHYQELMRLQLERTAAQRAQSMSLNMGIPENGQRYRGIAPLYGYQNYSGVMPSVSPPTNPSGYGPQGFPNFWSGLFNNGI
ncbi:hypothetical protein [Candidatus Nucleicultrix amoebiphila]|uniref:Uncharacterized protein n=1 Tax=Candidatus Nucleicultrix amoebiphila FS5 TaxID=1414854 RepID=A0A1W6N3M8_9PROT|nr:hypothetical protein [Candidatus Nucleicultrix amoebiphila]ARN84432.1 hypothetical protein GQ61_02840 [Candidatus Nucleicultrix amoebiphila FS5]